MQKGLKIDGTMRALAIALGGAILTSVIAMFIPVSVFEAITGATGFSELVPATGAPLGDTARAMIAFGFGALAFAALAAYLLRKPARVKAPTATVEPAEFAADDTPSFMEKMRGKIGDYMESRRNADAVKELSDLPKLRAGDAHPDAPPRRPISAHRDFGEVDTGIATVDESATAVALEQAIEEQTTAPVDAMVEPQSAEPEPNVAEQSAPDAATVTNMVDRLEWAVAERQEQIAKLEVLASAEIAKPELPLEAAAAVEVASAPEPLPAPIAEIVTPGTRQSILSQQNLVQPISAQPVLEVVPSEPATELVEDDMDAALRSALETLHRMNARTR